MYQSVFGLAWYEYEIGENKPVWIWNECINRCLENMCPEKKGFVQNIFFKVFV